jgi:hypothetical protein
MVRSEPQTRGFFFCVRTFLSAIGGAAFGGKNFDYAKTHRPCQLHGFFLSGFKHLFLLTLVLISLDLFCG